MTIEEKARAYDYSKARMIKACDEHRCSLYFMNEIFPEPKVLKDEEMNLAIIQFLEYASSYGCPDILSKKKAKTWIAWLEKQDEENVIEALRLEYERGKADALQEQRKEWTAEDLLNRNQIADILQEYNRGDLIKWLEKQVEQKSINYTDEEIVESVKDTSILDLVEPKFKAGDWIIDIQDGAILHINKVHEYAYEVTNLKGGVYQISRCSIETSYKPWTIQDAKDGDVLATDKSVFIYAKVLYNKPYAYCGVDKFSVFKDNCLEYDWANSVDSVHPATEEQYDTLMKAMADAGYTFDFEKKELKKIENKPLVIDEGKSEMDYCFTKMMKRINPAWSEDDEVELNGLIKHYEDGHVSTPRNRKTINWLKSLKDRVQPQPQKEWCKEDENRFNNLKQLVKHSNEGKGTKEGFIKFIDKLKKRWKPSEEQLTILLNATNGNYISDSNRQVLSKLYRNLKKL